MASNCRKDIEVGFLHARARKVHLLKRDEPRQDWDMSADPRLTVWEAAQHLIHTLDTQSERAAAILLAQVGGLGEAARDLAYRLYTLCERKGWAAEADVLGYIKQELAASPTGAAFLSRFVAVLAKRKRSDLVEPLAISCLPPSLGRTDAYMEIARGYRQNDEVKAAVAFLDAMGQRFPDDKAIGALPTAFLVESLAAPSSTTRTFVLKQLYARSEKARAIGALNELFAKTNDVNVQLDVLAALVEIQNAEALPFLKASLSHNSKEVRREAAKALGQLGDKRAKRPLRQQLKVEQDPSVKTALKDALHRIDPKAKEHPPLKASSVVIAMIEGGLLGAIWGWVQTFFWIIPGLSDGSITLIFGAISGAVILGFPISVVRPSKSQDDGCLTLFGGGAVIGGVVGIAMILLMPILIGSPMLSFGYINDNVMIIMSAVTVAVLSVPVVIAFKTERFWILPVTGLLLVAVVTLPMIRWTGLFADAVAQGKATLAATFAQSSSSPQDEAIVAATTTVTPVMEATRSDSLTPRPSPTVPAGVTASAQSAKVMSVTDGHAIRVELVDGTATIRYAGLLVPTGDMMGADSAAQASRELQRDPWVWLETTSSAPAGADVEAQIWLADGTLANQELVEMGYALPDFTLQDDMLASQLKQAAREAWQAQAGFWAGDADVAPWAAVVVDTANIRQGPGTDRPVAGKATRGDIFVINGRNANGDWLQIKAGDAVAAWIFAELAQTMTAISSLFRSSCRRRLQSPPRRTPWVGKDNGPCANTGITRGRTRSTTIGMAPRTAGRAETAAITSASTAATPSIPAVLSAAPRSACGRYSARCQAVCSDDFCRFCGPGATKVATTNQRVCHAFMVRVLRARPLI